MNEKQDVSHADKEELKCDRWSHLTAVVAVRKLKHFDECEAWAAATFRNEQDKKAGRFNPDKLAGVYVCPGDPTHWHVGHDRTNAFQVPPTEWLKRQEAVAAMKVELQMEVSSEIAADLAKLGSLEVVFMRMKEQKKALEAELEIERSRRLSARIRKILAFFR